jgi:mycothione reductase
MRHFDLAIVGTGSGNSILDKRFAGWNVALIERGRFGGTCLNVGCIPTKMLVHTADLARVPGAAARLGVDAALNGVRWPDIRDRIFGRIDPIAERGREYRISHANNRNVTVYQGNGAFTGHKRLTIIPNDGGQPQTITADQIVLAAGGRPVVPDIEGMAGLTFYTSDTVMRLDRLPRRMIIVGSGFVAAEFAHVFGSLGVDVTVIARSGALLRGEDIDVSARFTDLARRQWDVRLYSKVMRAEHDGAVTRLHLEGPHGAEAVDGDALLVAVGRRPNTDQLGVAATGPGSPAGRTSPNSAGCGGRCAATWCSPPDPSADCSASSAGATTWSPTAASAGCCASTCASTGCSRRRSRFTSWPPTSSPARTFLSPAAMR